MVELPRETTLPRNKSGLGSGCQWGAVPLFAAPGTMTHAAAAAMQPADPALWLALPQG